MQHLNIVSSLVQILVDANYIMFSSLYNSYHSVHLLGTYGHRWQRCADLESVLEGHIRVNKGRQGEDKGILKPSKEQGEVSTVGGCGLCSLAASKGRTDEWDAHKRGLRFLFLLWLPSLSPLPLSFREGSVSSLTSTYVSKPGSHRTSLMLIGNWQEFSNLYVGEHNFTLDMTSFTQNVIFCFHRSSLVFSPQLESYDCGYKDKYIS